MNELYGKPEMTDIKNQEIDNFKEIKPESDTSAKEARSFVDGLFNETREKSDGYFTDIADRLRYTPSENRVTWEAEPGKSKCIPRTETEQGKAAHEKLSAYRENGIEYNKDCEPDFSKCSESTVIIDNMTENRDKNFIQADIKCAVQFNAEKKNDKSDWTPRDVAEWRQENRCSWHECCDTKTMHLVSQDIHSFFTHSGGVAECKARDNNGGGFDE